MKFLGSTLTVFLLTSGFYTNGQDSLNQIGKRFTIYIDGCPKFHSEPENTCRIQVRNNMGFRYLERNYVGIFGNIHNKQVERRLSKIHGRDWEEKYKSQVRECINTSD